MDREFTGSGDPRRSLELLWGRQEPGRRGPKQRLSTDEVVQAAIALADAEGVQALSMRRVAQAVGVSPMSLYTYVPSKAELVDLMFDRALVETADPGEDLAGWRAKLAFIARERWALNARHPWLQDLALHRPPLGPNVLRKAEVMLRALDGMGLDDEDMGLAAEALQNYIGGALLSARDAREAEQRSGLTDEQWFAIVTPALEAHYDPLHYPSVKRMGEARSGRTRSPSERTARFEFGLERVLDGLDAFIRARHAAT
ncbi:TetR/AcrR family transcriptional regulator [Phenylobacterium sp.]|uniref:TetR/AcrR family transcriptional regulator n=1 Tax=Phenylobacterium sp. TaxID=1871053 RepID=UPI00260144A6|nr:TetR/AcrR family transcriptional regulator [Phenylobacterium sp.]